MLRWSVGQSQRRACWVGGLGDGVNVGGWSPHTWGLRNSEHFPTKPLPYLLGIYAGWLYLAGEIHSCPFFFSFSIPEMLNRRISESGCGESAMLHRCGTFHNDISRTLLANVAGTLGHPHSNLFKIS